MQGTGLTTPLMTVWLPVVIAFAAASVAAVTDVVEFRVRNALTLPLMAAGLIYHSAVSGWTGLSTSFLGLLFGLGVLIVPWLLGLMGAGDVKLLAGVGAWLGLSGALIAFVVASVAAGLYAVLLIVYRGKIRESLLTLKVICYRFVALGTYFGKEDLVQELSAGPDRRLRVIPFGAMVPIGIVAALLWHEWITGRF